MHKWESEFFKLAAVWLMCRHYNVQRLSNDPLYTLVGEMDNAVEMYLLIQENK